MSASNAAKDRMTSDDLYVYKTSDSSVTLSPGTDKKLVQCEIAGLIMLIFKGKYNFSLIFVGHKKASEAIVHITTSIITFQNVKELARSCIVMEKHLVWHHSFILAPNSK